MKDYKQKQQEENRPKFIAGLRQLADAFEAHPELLVPDWKQDITVWISKDSENPDYVKEEYKKFIKALGGTAKDSSDWTFELNWAYGLLNLRLCTDRDNVCEKVVTGTKIIPASESYIVEAQPERTEELYEWRCTSLLKD